MPARAGGEKRGTSRVADRSQGSNSAKQPAWSHVVELVNDAHSPKRLLLAAIGAVGAVGSIPPAARKILVDLAGSEDEEIAEAAGEGLAEAEGASDEEDEPEDDWIG
jgi:hypothetical protein